MSEKQSQPHEASLTIKDRLNYPYYLGDAILTCNRSVLSEDSRIQVVEAAKNFRGLIPQAWEDKQFKKDMKKAKVMARKDIRPIVAGNIRGSEEMCKKLGVPCYEEYETFDYEKLRWACINLLNRLGMLTKKKYTEKMTGKPYIGDGEESDVTETDLEEL